MRIVSCSSNVDKKHCFRDSTLSAINHVWPCLTRLLARCTTNVFNYGQLSLAILPWVGAMSTSQKAMMPCGWGVKAGMVREWVAGKTA